MLRSPKARQWTVGSFLPVLLKLDIGPGGLSERTHVITNNKALPVLAVLLIACFLPTGSLAQTIPNGAAIDAEVNKLMTRTGGEGMAVAVVDRGKVGYVRAYGFRNANGDPLTVDTVMYGASLTKAVFAYTVMQLVDRGKLKLDSPIREDLDNPLPSYGPDPVFPGKYGPYKDLADDLRWQKITPRMSLTHSTGLANFSFLEPDNKLRIHFEPGTRFNYSGKVSSCCNSSSSTAGRRRDWGSTWAI